MRFSVVIPTYNRSKKLVQCLKALFEQNYAKTKFEIIVVDDGSQDDTQKVLARFQKKSLLPLRAFFQTNQGQGVARNKGIEHAHGEIILFIGDDIIATKNLLREHDRVHHFHPEENAAVLGFITWHPALEITPLMRFMERGGVIFGRFGGHQFAYDLLRGKRRADFRFFYTSNISLKRSLLLQHKFDPWFAGYGWEDIELGYRLTQRAGLKLYYEPNAAAYHNHAITREDFENRMRRVGEASHIIHAKYPELQKIPSYKKRAAFRILSHPISLRIIKAFSQNLYFYALSKKYFLEGVGKKKL